MTADGDRSRRWCRLTVVPAEPLPATDGVGAGPVPPPVSVRLVAALALRTCPDPAIAQMADVVRRAAARGWRTAG